MTLEGLYQDLQRFGVDVEAIKRTNPSELQLIDMVGGLEICYRCTREHRELFSHIVGMVNAGELVTQ